MIRIKENAPHGGHGRHWQAVDRNFHDSVLRYIEETTENPDSTHEFYRRIKESQCRQCIRIFTRSLNALVTSNVIAVGDEIQTAFPASLKTTRHVVRIAQVVEWANGLEGWIRCVTDGVSFNFFAVDYLECRDTYVVGNEVTIHLGALSYWADSWEDFVDDPSGYSLGSACFPLVFLGSGGWPDDYFIAGRICGIRKTDEAVALEIMTDKWGTDFTICSVCRTDIASTIAHAQRIHSSVWLHGKIEA